MRKRLPATFVTLAISACLIGCVGKAKFPTYYTLHLPPPADMPPAAGTRPSVAVGEFRSGAYLRQGAIVYRATPEQVGFYQYHRWAVDPREFLTNAIVDRLRASGRFAEVKIYDGHSDVDFILSGRLEQLEEVDYEGGVRVEVALSAQMTDLHSGKVVWTNAASENEPVEKRTVAAVVAEMSQAMDRTIQKLLASLTFPSITTLNQELTPHPARAGW
jgi:ABC-type uncharacterized transport system auxiliary subunit